MTASGGTTTPFRSVAPGLGFVGGYDGLRGILLLMVMTEHANVGNFRSFAAVVDLFFVISGFLITTLLIQEHDKNGNISLRQFYSRRAIRLFPSVYLMLITVLVLVALVGTFSDFVGVLKEAGASAGYVYHLVYPVGLNMWQDTTNYEHGVVMAQMWSLSVEEHFYAIIAFLLIFLVKRNTMRQAAVVLLGVVVAIGLSRYLFHPGPRLLWLQRPDGLAMGMFAAIVNAYMPESFVQRHRKKFLGISTVGLAITVFALFAGCLAVYKVMTGPLGVEPMDASGQYYNRGWATLYWPYSQFDAGVPEEPWVAPTQDIFYWWQWGHSAAIIAFLPVVIALTRYKDWWVNRFLSWHPFRWLGRLSYTVYVWHGFIFNAIHEGMKGQPKPVVMFFQFGISFAVSIPVYYKVEKAVTRRFRYRNSTETEALDLETGKMVSIEELTADPKKKRKQKQPQDQ